MSWLSAIASPKITAPALWGKLPSHADYVQHRVLAGEAEAWQDWLSRYSPPAQVRKPVSQAALRSETWVNVDPQPERAWRTLVPASFVLGPATLAFAPEQYVVGVVVHSQDRIGRVHPLVVYQQANLAWVKQYFFEPAENNQDWLYAMAALVAPFVSKAGAPGQQDLPDLIDRLWAAFEPTWLQRLARRSVQPSVAHLQQHLQQLRVSDENADPAAVLHGVQFLPWTDWPQRLWQLNADAETKTHFWQQDQAGRYVGAALTLRELWAP